MQCTLIACVTLCEQWGCEFCLPIFQLRLITLYSTWWLSAIMVFNNRDANYYGSWCRHRKYSKLNYNGIVSDIISIVKCLFTSSFIPASAIDNGHICKRNFFFLNYCDASNKTLPPTMKSSCRTLIWYSVVRRRWVKDPINSHHFCSSDIDICISTLLFTRSFFPFYSEIQSLSSIYENQNYMRSLGKLLKWNASKIKLQLMAQIYASE